MQLTFVNSEINARINNFLIRCAALGNVQFLQNGFILAILAAVASSSKSILVKVIYLESTLSPIQLLTARLLFAMPIFLLLAFWPNRRTTNAPSILKPKLVVLIVWLGFSGYYFASLTDFIGLTYISAGLERIILFTYPILVILIEMLWYKRKPSRGVVVGSLLCFVGLSAAFGHDLQLTNDQSGLWTGVGWVALSGLSFALYYMGLNKATIQVSARRITGFAGVAASLMTFIHLSIVDDWQFVSTISFTTWLLIGVMAIVCTILPSLFLALAIRKIGPSLTANIGALGPVITIVLAWLILNEMLSFLQVAGMSLVILGIRRMKKTI